MLSYRVLLQFLQSLKPRRGCRSLLCRRKPQFHRSRRLLRKLSFHRNRSLHSNLRRYQFVLIQLRPRRLLRRRPSSRNRTVPSQRLKQALLQ